MRFQTSLVVDSRDPEVVLHALESCLRDMSSEVVRAGSEITLRGLGPSPLAVNRRDTTILRVETQGDRTLVNADVSFQASSLLGNAPQHEVVQSKLDRIFEQVTATFGIRSEVADVSIAPPVAERPVAEVGVTAPEIEAAPSDIPLPLAEIESVSVSSGSTGGAETADAVNFGGAGAEAATLDSLPPETDAAVVQEKDVVSADGQATAKREIPAVQDVPKTQVPSHQDLLFTSVEPRRSRTPAIAIVASLALLATGWYVLHGRVSAVFSVPPPPTLPAPSNPPDVQPSSPVVSPEAASPMTEGFAADDPKVWLNGWVAAMRTRDPVAQARFYADPVDRYLGKRNISNAEVLAEKRAAILNRDGLWTVKLESIRFNQQDEDDVSIHLVKHYMAETEPAEISEQSIPCRLELKRIDGQWRITSEKDQP